MALTPINVGTSANDGTGDPIRTAYQRCNTAFLQVDDNVVAIATKVTTGGALGTPSSGTLTHCTGLPAAGVTGTALTLAGGTLTGLLNFSGTTHAGIRLNSLTTTQRDALTAGAGDFLFNSTLSQFQGYTGAAWASMATLGANTFTAAQTFNATTGAIFPGATSGNATLLAPAVAGTSTITLPGVTSTLATLGANSFTGAQLNVSNLVQFGGATSASSALKVSAFNSANLAVRKADDSDFAILDAGGFQVFSHIFANRRIATFASNCGGSVLGFALASDAQLTWTSVASTSGDGGNGGNADLRLLRGGANILQLGIDAAPVSNQHFKACNRITSNGVGANLTISGGNGRGGAGGDLILASYTTAGSGVAGTLTTRWQLDAATGALLPGATATYNLGSTAAVLANVYSTDYYSGSIKVVGAQGAAVADASGGAIVDAEARTAINDLLARIRTHGLIAT